jgi:transposase
MQAITTIGLDIAKSVFQIHGVDADDQVVIRRQLKRRYVLAFFEKLPPCLVGIEACASSHHWSRELQTLGHTVRLMPPGYVKPYVKRQKDDMADAEAICEAVTGANMRFVPNTWLHRPQACDVKILLANSEPSTHRLLRRLLRCGRMSLIGGGGDLKVTSPKRRD